MIGRIAGIILHRAQDHVLIDVRGVGYIVHVSERTAAGLPPVGQAAALYTDLMVREDLLQLFGFIFAANALFAILYASSGLDGRALLQNALGYIVGILLFSLFDPRPTAVDRVG